MAPLRSFAVMALVLGQAILSQAHLAIYHPSMYGQERNNINSDHAAQPLQDYPFSKWWWHGDMNDPPSKGIRYHINANGHGDLEISSNKAQTSMGRGLLPNPRIAPNPFNNTGNGWGNMHANTRAEVAGCALAIAYESDPKKVKPEDFVIMSVVHDCPARQLQRFEFPDLMPCPKGGCHCAWFWIHKSVGGTDQMYMNPFVCDVRGSSKTAKKLGKPIPPVKCDQDKTKCVVGAKQPMYWKNIGHQNMFEPGHQAPTYSNAYNFKDGAQKDIFVNGHAVGQPKTTATKKTATTTKQATTSTKKAAATMTK